MIIFYLPLYHYSFLFFIAETYHLPQLFDAIDLKHFPNEDLVGRT